jgi:acetolactate synthase-1/2/3 large subunit
VKKYSDLLAEWLVELGYTHCFFVAGGNIMHVLESFSHKLNCVPVVHEVAAGIAAEYFNEVQLGKKAIALVTAGPGLTNIMTAIAGAWLESRELLVIGGQVKVSDLSRGKVRQRGIQEIDGVAIARPVTERSLLLDKVVDRAEFAKMIRSGAKGRKGPVFVEVPLDIQAAIADEEILNVAVPSSAPDFDPIDLSTIDQILSMIRKATRPVILLGSGIDRNTAEELQESLAAMGVPLMLTWNAMDRLGADHPLYFGRPNTWGQRYSNILLQQADLLVALGSRLSLQQTGFNWQEFVPVGQIIQVDCDSSELSKGHPAIAVAVCGDANYVLRNLSHHDLGHHGEWIRFCSQVRQTVPLVEPVNHTGEGYLSPYLFVEKLSNLAQSTDIIIPCSSGGAFTVMMQTFAQKFNQRIVTNKGLASMGYGLSGAIGAAFAAKGRRTILVEGDGGFTQNLQELGTVSANNLNLKIFLFDDDGYASIRMSQVNYFGGHYVGCDRKTGLGIPNWERLFWAYDIPVMHLQPGFEASATFREAFAATGPRAFLVPVDPKQTYSPKITSRVTATGSMESNPLNRMSPDLPAELAAQVFRYIAPPE